MLNSEIDKVQAALGYLEACASLYANASDGPVMKAQIQAQTDRVRKALVAAQAEARGLRAENQRLRARMAAVSDKLKRIADAVANGDFSGHSLLDERLLIGSRIDDVAYDDLAPTTEQQDDWPESRIDVIGQNGNDGHHYAHAERESLPLMARREWMQNHVFVAIGPNGEQWGVTEPGVLSGAARVYRIAATDEHGLKVVERTADMPEGAKYREWTRANGEVVTCHYLYPPLAEDRWGALERIEDYNERGQEGQGDA